MQPNEITEVLNRPGSRQMLTRDVARLAYVATDGTPRASDRLHLERGPAGHVHHEERPEAAGPASRPGGRFQTTLPSGVEELVLERERRQHA